MAGYWPRLFLHFYGPRLLLGPYKRKKELGQYPAILTSRLVNNAYILADTLFNSHAKKDKVFIALLLSENVFLLANCNLSFCPDCA